MNTTVVSERERVRNGAPRRLLVVVDEPCPALGLCSAVARAAVPTAVEALVVVPAHGSAAAQWYVDEDAVRADAAHRLRTCVSCLSAGGIAAAGRLADPEPVYAIADALHDFEADEILLVTAAQQPSRWLHKNVLDRVRDSVALPVKHVVVPAKPATPGA